MKNFKTMASYALASCIPLAYKWTFFSTVTANKSALFKWVISNVMAIGATNNTHNFWWINQGQPVCPLDMVHNQLSDNGKLRKLQYKKWISPETLWWKHMWHMNITKPIFQFFVQLTSFVVALSLKLYYSISPFCPNLRPNQWTWIYGLMRIKRDFRLYNYSQQIYFFAH